MKDSFDDIYKPENVPLYEALYGENLISLGGKEAIDNMFSDIVLNHLKLLDLGFGLGGVAFYLSKKFQAKISGIEIQPWMVQFAQTHAPKEISDLLQFDAYDKNGHIPFEKNSFDVVYSKGVLNHVKEKHSLFTQIYQMLKPNGLFVIADWVHPEHTENKDDPLAMESELSYREVLNLSGFKQVDFRDDSSLFKNYVDAYVKNLIQQKEFIVKNFGDNIFSEILQQHQGLIKNIDLKRKFAVRIKASKQANWHNLNPSATFSFTTKTS